MRNVLASGLALLIGWTAGAVQAEGPSQPAAAACLGRPVAAACLGRPVAAGGGAGDLRVLDANVRPASCNVADLAPPQPVVRAQAPDPGLPPPPPVGPAPTDERYNCGVVTQNPSTSTGNPWLGKLGGLFTGFGAGTAGGRNLFQSDHCFDNFISPVSNPFLAEDPRALTEARPIFIYQQAPGSNPLYRGGDIEFVGLRASLAFTDWFSVELNKFGYLWDEPHSPVDGVGAHSGISELWVGPKVTFLRIDSTKTLGAAGAIFQIPIGSSDVFQDTGTLSIVPYLALGQNFLKSTYGSFNALNTVGYAIGVDNVRSDYLYDSLHLDFDVGNLQRIWPLVELNYFHYTSAGKARNLNFEGRDLFNFGSTGVSGKNELSVAAGARVKVLEWLQTGLVGEVPVTGNKDILGWRITFDVIFRY